MDSLDQDQVYDIKFHGNPVNKIKIKNSNIEKIKEKNKTKKILFSANGAAIKVAKTKNKDKNNGINNRATGIKLTKFSSCVSEIDIQ